MILLDRKAYDEKITRNYVKLMKLVRFF